jgi:hypothetical protein
MAAAGRLRRPPLWEGLQGIINSRMGLIQLL